MLVDSIMRRGLPIGFAVLLGACTAHLPADLELVSVQATAGQEGIEPAALHSGDAAVPWRLVRVDFTSRVNLVRFVTVNSYSLGVEADFCDGPEAPQPLVIPGIYWRGQPLVPGEPDPIRRESRSSDDPLDYYFFLNADHAAATPADICFTVAGGNDARGYRSNRVTIPQVEITLALQD